MTIVFTTTTTSSAQRKITTRQNRGQASSKYRRRPLEIAMESVATLLVDHRSKPSQHATKVLRQQIRLVEGAIAPSDVLSTITDTWAALLVLYEADARGSDMLQARQRLVVVLAEMLCSPVQMPPSHRQRYWNLLQHHFRILNRGAECVRGLERVDDRFPSWIRSLNAVVQYGEIRPVAFPSALLSRKQRLSADEQLDYHSRCRVMGAAPSADEAQYFGNSVDHWRRHTSQR